MKNCRLSEAGCRRRLSAGGAAGQERRVVLPVKSGAGAVPMIIGILVVVALVAVGWWWNAGRQVAAETKAKDALKQLKALAMPGADKHIMSLIVDKNLAEALPHIGQLRWLTSLNLANTEFGDADVDQIASLPRLYSLDVSNTRLTDAGVAKMASIPVEALYLSGTPITAQALDSVAKMRTLKVLVLDGTPTHANLVAVTKLPNLEWLMMNNMELGGVDDATWDAIAAIPKLGRLTMKASGVSDQVAARLKTAKPALQVETTGESGSPLSPADAGAAAGGAATGAESTTPAEVTGGVTSESAAQ